MLSTKKLDELRELEKKQGLDDPVKKKAWLNMYCDFVKYVSESGGDIPWDWEENKEAHKRETYMYIFKKEIEADLRRLQHYASDV